MESSCWCRTNRIKFLVKSHRTHNQKHTQETIFSPKSSNQVNNSLHFCELLHPSHRWRTNMSQMDERKTWFHFKTLHCEGKTTQTISFKNEALTSETIVTLRASVSSFLAPCANVPIASVTHSSLFRPLAGSLHRHCSDEGLQKGHSCSQ